MSVAEIGSVCSGKLLDAFGVAFVFELAQTTSSRARRAQCEFPGLRFTGAGVAAWGSASLSLSLSLGHSRFARRS